MRLPVYPLLLVLIVSFIKSVSNRNDEFVCEICLQFITTLYVINVVAGAAVMCNEYGTI